jgi:hypothetical protein
MFDIHQPVIDPESGELDEDAFEDYVEGLMEEFADSPEGRQVAEEHGRLNWAAMVMEYAVNYLGVPPPEMSARDFREVVFEIIPRKVSTEADQAGAIVAELRAFWQFLQRAYQLKNGGPILAALKGDAVARLERELANPANFGMAKSFIMMGQQMGFDMTTQEGLDAFTAYYNSRLPGGMPPGPFGGLIPGPPDEFGEELNEGLAILLPPGQSPKQRAQLRKKRKAQRQARKRNRRRK